MTDYPRPTDYRSPRESWIRSFCWVGLPGHQIAFNAPLSH